MMRKGDISTNTIFIIVITLVSIIMLLGLFSTKFPSFSKNVYCNTFFFIHSAAFVPSNLRADQSYCTRGDALEPPITLTADQEMNVTLLAHLLACWKRMEYGKYSENRLCYELTVSSAFKDPYLIEEREIARLIYDNDLCEILPDSDVDIRDPAAPVALYCGDNAAVADDRIEWLLGDTVYPEQNILIEYNSSNKLLIIS